MRVFFISVLVITAAIVAALKVNYPSGSWRYKITVEVETPEGIKSGSAVREIDAWMEPVLNPDVGAIKYKVSGEAVAVDLGQRGVLFALVNWDSTYDVMMTFPFSGNNQSPELIRYYSRLNQPKTVNKNRLIQLVTFDDLNDPLTVRSVGTGNIEGIFGKGVRVKDITIEMTDERVTRGIEKRLPWLQSVLMTNIDGTRSTSENKLSNTLHGGNFSTGEK